MAQQTKAAILRNELEGYLITLKRNRENVSLELLKTTYAAGYSALCTSIKQTASAYLKETVLDDIRIHVDYVTEGSTLIQNCIDDTGLLKQLSRAVFCNQDLSEFDILATKLRETVLSCLENFYYQHLGLYISARCLQEPYPAPEIYCPVNGCILQNEEWIRLEEFQKTEETNYLSIQPTEQQISA